VCLSNKLNDCVSGQTETSGRTGQLKVSIDSFIPVRILGERGFGKVVLAKMKASDGSDQRFAIKVMKKSHIISCCNVSSTVTEKEALVLASGCPFIMTLLVLPNKGNFQFFEPALYFQRVITTEIYHQYKNVIFRCICKIAKMDYELRHVCLAVRLSVCVEQLSYHWADFH
jgi:hypothetical protein